DGEGDGGAAARRAAGSLGAAARPGRAPGGPARRRWSAPDDPSRRVLPRGVLAGRPARAGEAAFAPARTHARAGLAPGLIPAADVPVPAQSGDTRVATAALTSLPGVTGDPLGVVRGTAA